MSIEEVGLELVRLRIDVGVAIGGIGLERQMVAVE